MSSLLSVSVLDAASVLFDGCQCLDDRVRLSPFASALNPDEWVEAVELLHDAVYDALVPFAVFFIEGALHTEVFAAGGPSEYEMDQWREAAADIDVDAIVLRCVTSSRGA